MLRKYWPIVVALLALATLADAQAIRGTLVNFGGSAQPVTVSSGTVTTVSAVTAISNALPSGNNNIGDVDVATLPALVAGTAVIGKVRVVDAAGDEVTDGTANAVKTLAVDAAGTAIPAASVSNGAADSGTARVAVSDKGANTAANAIPVTLATDRNFCADGSQVAAVAISTATSGNVQLVAISGSTIVYVCGFDVTSQADVSMQFVSGTGTACATGETDRTGIYPLVAASGAGMRGIVRSNGGAVQFKGAAGEAMCVELSGAVQIDGLLTYVQR